MQDQSARRGFLAEELRRSAVEMGQATANLPQRVQRISSTISRLEAGTLKPRVRVLESERAARREGILQVRLGGSKLLAGRGLSTVLLIQPDRVLAGAVAVLACAGAAVLCVRYSVICSLMGPPSCIDA